MNAHLLLICALAGLCALLALPSLISFFQGRWEVDRQWVVQTANRFSPDPVNVNGWLLLLYGCRVGIFLTLWLILPSSITAVGLWLLSLYLPGIAVDILWSRRRERIEEQLPLTILFMANSVGAGLTLIEAIQRLADQAQAPIRTEYRIIANRYAMGSDLESALTEAKNRLNISGFNIFVSALLVNRQMGGDIAVTLRRISASLERLKELRLNILAQTAEGRTNIKVLAVAPLLMLLMMRSIDPEGVNLLFTTIPGMFVLLVAVSLATVGFIWARKIIGADI